MSHVPESTSPRRVRGFTLEQPESLEATLLRCASDLPRLCRPTSSYREVRLVGSGSSKNALAATAPTFRRVHGCGVRLEGPLEFLRDVTARPGGAADETLVVVVSQSGSSSTTVEALEAAQANGLRTLALTADAHSPFGRSAHESVVLPIGHEDIGPKTKGYTATLAALLALAEATAPAAPAASTLPADPAAYSAWFADMLPEWDALGATLAERHHDADHIMVIGAGRHVGTALEGSLKLQEMAGLAASAFDLEESLHGRFHGLGPRSLALFLAGDTTDEALARAAASVLGGLAVPAVILSTVDAPAAADDSTVARIGRFGSSDELDVLSAVVPLQCFAERVAHRRGVDPDAMRYPDLSARLGIKLPRR
jgi:glucoselysine-6-phosphate deglycase